MKVNLIISAVIVACLVWYFGNVGAIGRPQTKVSAAKIFVTESLKFPFTAFHTHMGRYPTTEEGFAVFFRAPQNIEGKWRGPYIADEHKIRDPWGREYQYRYPAVKSDAGYDVWSLGADGIPSADDIGNWKNKEAAP